MQVQPCRNPTARRPGTLMWGGSGKETRSRSFRPPLRRFTGGGLNLIRLSVGETRKQRGGAVSGFFILSRKAMSSSAAPPPRKFVSLIPTALSAAEAAAAARLL